MTRSLQHGQTYQSDSPGAFHRQSQYRTALEVAASSTHGASVAASRRRERILAGGEGTAAARRGGLAVAHPVRTRAAAARHHSVLVAFTMLDQCLAEAEAAAKDDVEVAVHVAHGGLPARDDALSVVPSDGIAEHPAQFQPRQPVAEVDVAHFSLSATHSSA